MAWRTDVPARPARNKTKTRLLVDGRKA